MFTVFPPALFTNGSLIEAYNEYINQLFQQLGLVNIYAIACPVRPMIIDELGQKCGIQTNGQIINEIQRATVKRLPTNNVTGDSLTILTVPPNHQYKIVMNSYAVGQLHFESISSNSNGDVNSNYIDSINISSKSVIYFNEANPYKIEIDTNGDNIIDTTINTYDELITGINNYTNTAQIPKNFELFQNYPNPFNPNTTIQYSIPQQSFVTLKMYDLTGRLIKTLVNKEESSGYYHVQFNAENLASGIYFYRLKTNNFVETKKLILLK
jgi:Secretion system C-terminal sorting domain